VIDEAVVYSANFKYSQPICLSCQEEEIMKRKVIKVLCVILSIGILFLVGCAAKKPVAPAAPEWVTKGSGAFDVDKRKVFHGVGVASGIRNEKLLTSTADNRARAEVAKILETYLAVLAKDYMASTTAGDMKASSEEQSVGQVYRNFSMAVFQGVQITDHWRNPVDGNLFSLCELDLYFVKNALKEFKELDSKWMEYAIENAERIHRRLEETERE